MSKNAKLEQNFKSDFIMSDDMIFANHNETDVLIREEAQYLASQMNSSRYFDSLENNDDIPKDLYDNIINEKLLVDADNQDKICSVIEKNNTLLNKLLDKIDDSSKKSPIATSVDNKEIPVVDTNVVNKEVPVVDKEYSFNKKDYDALSNSVQEFIDKENSFYEHTEKNNSIIIDYFKNEISSIRELMKNDKLDINETNKEILYYLENELVVNDVLNNKEIFDKIDKNIDDKLVKNNSILNKNFNVWIEEVISKIQDLKDNLTKMNYREELDYLLNAQSNNENSIIELKENIENKFSENNSNLKSLVENVKSDNENSIIELKENIENKFFENNSNLNNNLNSLVDDAKSKMEDLKLEISKLNCREELDFLLNAQSNNENSIIELGENIDNKFSENNSNLNINLNYLVQEIKSRIDELREEVSNLNCREELDHLLNMQINNEGSIVKVKEEVEKNIEASLIKNNSTLNRNFNSLIEDLKYEIQDIKTEINGLNYREELDELLHIQNKSENSIDVMTKDIDSRIDELEAELKKLNYRKELDGLLEAQFHYIENANSSKKEIHEKINYIENDFSERIQNIEHKLSSNLNIINELKNSHDSNEIDNLITDKLVTIVEEKINTIDSKMMFLKKEIENNLNNLIEKQFETNIVKSSEYNKKIKNETLNIIYNELNKFNNKFENLNEEIIKNYDLLMINNRVLDTLEDLLSDQYSKKNDLDIERKNLIDELIKKAEHNKELIIILQNKIDYSIDNTDLYNSIIRKTISRDSDFLRQVDDQTYNYVKNLTLELVSKELSKYTNFVKNDTKELEVEQIELNLTDESYENKIDNSSEVLDLEALDQILTNDEIIETEIIENENDNSKDTSLEDSTPMVSEEEIVEPIITDTTTNSEEEIIDEEEIVDPTITDEPIVDNEEEIVEPTIIDEPIIDDEEEDEEEIVESIIDDKEEEIIESIIIDESIIDNKEEVIEDIQLDKNEVKQEPIESNLDNANNTSKSMLNDDKIFRNNNPYFNYKIKELLLELMNNENESITNDIAFYKTNLLNQNSDYLNSEFYVQELENYFSTVKNIDEDNFNQGEPNG